MRVTTVFAACLVLLPALAAADKPDKGSKGHGGGQQSAVAADSGPHAELTVVFGAHEREAARSYFVEAHGKGKCPPGLAKKHNGCLPPGQAKKRYAVGRPLPAALVQVPPPPELARRLGAPPHGYVYVMVDGDLLKLVAGTMMVVDAVQALVQ
jgi:hypothetical protein